MGYPNSQPQQVSSPPSGTGLKEIIGSRLKQLTREEQNYFRNALDRDYDLGIIFLKVFPELQPPPGYAPPEAGQMPGAPVPGPQPPMPPTPVGPGAPPPTAVPGAVPQANPLAKMR
jgi:hypothetical protein